MGANDNWSQLFDALKKINAEYGDVTSDPGRVKSLLADFTHGVGTEINMFHLAISDQSVRSRIAGIDHVTADYLAEQIAGVGLAIRVARNVVTGIYLLKGKGEPSFTTRKQPKPPERAEEKPQQKTESKPQPQPKPQQQKTEIRPQQKTVTQQQKPMSTQERAESKPQTQQQKPPQIQQSRPTQTQRYRSRASDSDGTGMGVLAVIFLLITIGLVAYNRFVGFSPDFEHGGTIIAITGGICGAFFSVEPRGFFGTLIRLVFSAALWCGLILVFQNFATVLDVIADQIWPAISDFFSNL